jgi:hypothetical protein
MKKNEEFFEHASSNLDDEGYIQINRLKEIYLNKSSSFVGVNLNYLKKKGLVKYISPNKWRVVTSKKDEMDTATQSNKTEEPQQSAAKYQVLILTAPERNVFTLLTEVKIKCPEKNGQPRFNEDSVREILLDKNIPIQEWEGLKTKLLALRIIEAKGIGSKGRIFNLNEDLLLEYLTDETLVKETLWKEELIKQNLDKVLADFKARSVSIIEHENALAKKALEQETARLTVRKLEDELSTMKKVLSTDFPDKDQVIAFQGLLSSIENIGQKATLSFLKNIFEQ